MIVFLGIDGGGTGCRARVRAATGGPILAEVAGGSANVHSGGAAAIAELAAVCERAAAAAGVALTEVAIGAGLAGVVSAASAQTAARALGARLPAHSIAVDSDGYIACLGAHAGGDGGIVIAGTGSAALALVAGQRHVLGGWGFALGDEGSGALMGRAALRHALRSLDGLEPDGPLAAAILDRLGRDRDGPTRWSASATPADYAAFAPLVLAAADTDPAATAILAKSTDGVAALVSRLLALGAPVVALAGGLAPTYLARLPPALAPSLRAPLADALEGALLLAARAPVS